MATFLPKQRADHRGLEGAVSGKKLRDTEGVEVVQMLKMLPPDARARLLRSIWQDHCLLASALFGMQSACPPTQTPRAV
jgi:hypothetical protein